MQLVCTEFCDGGTLYSTPLEHRIKSNGWKKIKSLLREKKRIEVFARKKKKSCKKYVWVGS